MTTSNRAPSSTIRIATRKSKLALWQAEHVAKRLRTELGLKSELVPIVTKGDRILDQPLAEIGGKGLFLKELEQSLLANTCDIAVHSMKDVASDMPAELHIASLLERADPRDALLGAASLEQLPQNAIVGSASLRRQSQMLAKRPDLQMTLLRGNVDTRLAKLQQGEYHAIVLAVAGLERLGLGEHIDYIFPTELMIPAVGQGCIGIQCRREHTWLNNALATLSHRPTELGLAAERQCNLDLGGSCQAPIGIFGTWQANQLTLRGFVGDLTGTLCHGEVSAVIETSAAAIDLGAQLAQLIRQQGGHKLLTQQTPAI